MSSNIDDHIKLSEIHETYDFSLFRTNNFSISQCFLNKVKASLQEKNCSPDYPILVDKKFRVLDGKYRFIACRELGYAIHYKVAEVTNIVDSVRLKHIRKSMPSENICKVYSDLKPYNDILYIMEEFPDFHCDTIILATASCDSHIRGIDRFKLSTGRLGEFDIDQTRNKMILSKYILDKYGYNPHACFKIVKYLRVDEGKDEINWRLPTVEDIDEKHFIFSKMHSLIRYINDNCPGRNRQCPPDEVHVLYEVATAIDMIGQWGNNEWESYYSNLLSIIGIKVKTRKQIES